MGNRAPIGDGMTGNNFATFCGVVCIGGVILVVVLPALFRRQWSNLIGRLFTGWGRK